MERLIVEFINGRWWRLHHPYKQVPVGFVTDLASIPRFFWRVLPPSGPWAPAAVVHDYGYRTAELPRKAVDERFRDDMKQAGVPWWQRNVIYLAVRIFGRRFYNAPAATIPAHLDPER